MIIDIHTHIFPDALAPKALGVLEKNSGYKYSPVTDMTAKKLLKNMDDWGIDISVVQPVVTKPTQFFNINNWAREISGDRFVSFGGIYPSEKYKQDIDYVVGLGLKGLKFHSEYQNFIVDDSKMLPIYDYALSKGLILLFHGGYDPAVKPPFKSNPQRFAHVLDEMRGGDIIIAHLGGHAQWEDVQKYLVGRNVYLDTSMGMEYYPLDTFCNIVKEHGSERVLFGSDSPWSNAKKEIDILKSLPLSDEEVANILGKNAAKLLGLNFANVPRGTF